MLKCTSAEAAAAAATTTAALWLGAIHL